MQKTRNKAIVRKNGFTRSFWVSLKTPEYCLLLLSSIIFIINKLESKTSPLPPRIYFYLAFAPPLFLSTLQKKESRITAFGFR
jgi:hypothetical protein